MEKTDSIRSRLLTQLPQPENVAAYKEQVAVLLAKHQKALFWDGMAPRLISAIAVVLCLLSMWGRIRDPYLVAFACLAFIGAGIANAKYEIGKGQLNLLKEIKQLQLQMLELQASLHRTNDE